MPLESGGAVTTGDIPRPRLSLGGIALGCDVTKILLRSRVQLAFCKWRPTVSGLELTYFLLPNDCPPSHPYPPYPPLQGKKVMGSGVRTTDMYIHGYRLSILVVKGFCPNVRLNFGVVTWPNFQEFMI